MVDSNPSTTVRYDTHEIQPRLPNHVVLLFDVQCMDNMIKYMVFNEGAVACVMSLDYWKGLGAPVLSKYMTMLTTFDERSFRPHGIIPSLQVCFGEDSVSVKG